MAIELTTVFKVRELRVEEATHFADQLESALGDILEEEKIADVSAYFVSAVAGTNSIRVGLRFENMRQEFMSETAADVLEMAVQRVELQDDPSSSKHQLKRLSSELVSA